MNILLRFTTTSTRWVRANPGLQFNTLAGTVLVSVFLYTSLYFKTLETKLPLIETRSLKPQLIMF